jgi:hypothetical protein
MCAGYLMDEVPGGVREEADEEEEEEEEKKR